MTMRAFAKPTLARHVIKRCTSTSAEPPCPYRGRRPKDWGPPPPPWLPEPHEQRRERRFAAAAARFNSTFGGERDGGKGERPRISKVIEGTPEKKGYTAAYAMFEGLWEYVKPNTGKPQAVLVHVDVGTQALAHGVHNASIGRVPVIIVAGLCPSTESGELPGSKTEYSNWLQDAHDQTAIVRQYCRFTGEIRTGVNVKQMLGRAIQFAKSDPKGPVYLSATREVLAQDIEPYALRQEEWGHVWLGALPEEDMEQIASAMIGAKRPLLITGYSGRNTHNPELLAELAEIIPHLRVLDTGGSDMCFPAYLPGSMGFQLSTHDCTEDADFILVLDCDIPWIPSKNSPPPDAKIYHIDSNPLNAQLRTSFFPAHGRWRADSQLALEQLVYHIRSDWGLVDDLRSRADFQEQVKELAKAHAAREGQIKSLARLDDNDTLDGHNVGSLLKSQLPPSTTFVVEAVTNSTILHDQLQPSEPGKWLNCGATGIGWSNGAAVGVKLARQDEAQHEVKEFAWSMDQQEREKKEIVCQVVGDGSFMCAAPESALWVARKYGIPVLTVVLNNGGWNAPRNSVEMVYPDGLNKGATADELNLSFKPSPNYAAMAEAVAGGEDGWMKGVRARNVKEMKEALEVAVKRVQGERRAMLIEVLMN